MGKAKTASKNDPTQREKAKDIFFNGKKVNPVLCIGEGFKYMGIAYEDGSLVSDADGAPLPWSAVQE